jgi:hypothetical protein
LDRHVSKFAKGKGTLVTDCLFRFQTPVSPHLAIQRDAPSDQPTARVLPPIIFVLSVEAAAERSGLCGCY